MWRIQGLVYRALSRCHANAPLRITQGHHHVEDDVRSTSAVLSTGLLPPDSSSQTGGNGGRGRRERTSQFCYSGLPRYTALDAVGWGVAAMLLMQICRRIHSQFSSVSESNPVPGLYRDAGLLRRCGYRVLLEILSRQDALPRGIPLNCLGSVQAIQGSSSGHAPSPEGSTPSGTENVSLSNDSAQSGESWASSDCDPEDSSPSQTPIDKAKNPLCPEDEELTGAANNLKQIADSSVPVILNIIGLENAKSGDYQAAFSCFLASAQHGYSKAQFNVGVCYEKGRGVQRDPDKATQFYRQAATGGHGQAMYRYAKLLLHSRGQQSAEDTHAAIGLLEGAAASGAQAYLGVLFSQDSLRDEHKAASYLKMAAENGDSLSQLYLGQCYEWGIGVQQCVRTAVQLYQQAAKAGNQQAQNILSALYTTGSRVPEDAALRSIRSAPCFSVGLRLFPSLSSLEPSCSPFQRLPHSWSTGSFLGQSLPGPSLHPEGERTGAGSPCRWTIGLG
ncbi:death ligand signal enhancer isoform X2 [Conger conger]|uniref:death ligand signal enhancer isoform X2 n=1 Tax=Conger conger TaxID=82655 RepID=UPI002A59EFF5|nr:death ligand signal enhancer isoform X2 [Conger conger]